ncbi:Pol I core factor CF [Arthrobotrys musiformis]|uniref:Pol I core factor CF n=1 Tax=Arthrobotrys musiformis TaxID=47236 RepID=A0AAV9WFF8_9PEZI
MERQKGERCGIDNCRSRFYHLADGQWTCSNGHVQEGRLDIREDEEYQPRKGDRLVIETEGGVVEEKVFTGKKGLSLLLQGFQVVLRKQVGWMIDVKGFPKEFQVIVRDLWTLRLGAIYSERSSRTPSVASSGYTSADSATAYPSDAETASERSMSTRRGRSRSTSRGRRREVVPKLLDTITILYLASCLLRIHLDIPTLHGWILQQDIVYFRAIRSLPVDMVEKMEVKWRRKFEPKVMPTCEGVRRCVFTGIGYYVERFGVEVPRFMAQGVVGGWLLGFGCPPEVYPAVFALAGMIKSEMKYPTTGRYRLLNCPDVQLMALLVISLKLCWGLDDDDPEAMKYMKLDKRGRLLPRFAKREWEVANMKVEWDDWKGILEMKDGEVKKKANWQLEVDEAEIFGWSGGEIDEYLEWFEKNWGGGVEGKPTAGVVRLFEDDVNPDRNEEERNQTDEPTGAFEKKLENYTMLQSTMKLGKPIPAGRKRGRILRPGEKYIRYKKWGDIRSSKLKSLYLAAAGKVGVGIEGFVYVVQKLEHRLGEVSKGKEPMREVSDEEGGYDEDEEEGVGTGLEEVVDLGESEDEEEEDLEELLG